MVDENLGGSENQMVALLQQVRWAHHPAGASIQQMRVDHCRLHITAEQQLLDG